MRRSLVFGMGLFTAHMVKTLPEGETGVMARIAAANLILDRGIGKPQPAQVEQPPPIPFFQPLTEEQVQLAERMVKALPDGVEVKQPGAMPKQ